MSHPNSICDIVRDRIHLYFWGVFPEPMSWFWLKYEVSIEQHIVVAFFCFEKPSFQNTSIYQS